ncbi:hypothetical protein [Chondromyces crocatus]|uniref:DUF4351 domain-containing protein n=1 Tax=Chondromyces crocatus TaxID=52 RepID=A0A0K1EDC3_CHOCO|nr:hypothetical protein [Chondromyces crocatus]AKT38687.1 uncharacterized protein CMC5_028350 [Chondromyces crocatus]
MPSLPHEALVWIFRNQPMLAAALLRDVLHQVTPRFTRAEVVSGDATDAIPVERRADLVLLFECEGGAEKLAVIVEAQLQRDAWKRYVWLSYLAAVRERYRCPTWLLVVTPSEVVARWCGEAIELGHPGCVLRPLVLGPRGIPLVTEVEQARSQPELAVMSALAHGKGEAGVAIGKAFLQAAAGLDAERAAMYSDLVVASLNEAARRKLESMVKREYVFQTELVKRWVEQGTEAGKLEAKAQAVLDVLEARGLAVPAAVRERVLGSTDLTELDGWIRRAAVVSGVEALFAAPGS